jgi:hypothetical protein
MLFQKNYILSFCTLSIITLFSSCKNDKVFRLIDVSESGITFNNKIIEDSAINPMTLEFIYNGSGVAVGDFNTDGLPDLYFTGSRVKNELYINQGKFNFKNVTDKSGTACAEYWSSSASVVDINNDGKPDIYVSNSVAKNTKYRTNQFFLNMGLDKEGDPVFKDVASEYNLADTGHTVMTVFFDYDNDGDLDAYLLNTQPIERSPTIYQNLAQDSIFYSNDKLMRNDFDSLLGHPFFTDVSLKAGISLPGYGLGVNITDINHDGWKDIFVTNDFNNSDHLFINDQQGGFTEQSKKYFKHSSYNAMGNDVSDINNDCQQDIITVDMHAKDSYRKKMNMNPNSYQGYMNLLRYDYNIQYVRNTLQLNQGFLSSNKNDTSNRPVFSEIAFMSDIAETDWSWCPTIADFDNDGLRDILITNGYPRDVTDNDFMSYRTEASRFASWDNLLEHIPQIKIPNYAFKNNGSLTFEDVTDQWGLSQPSFSNGAVSVDLDADGDLDYVVNNINDPASVYENTISHDKEGNSYVQFSFKGGNQNKDGIGAELILFYDKGKKQYTEYTPYRGYLSSLEPLVHFGLGSITTLDSVKVIWPDRKQQLLKNVSVNQRIKLDYKNATQATSDPFDFLYSNTTSLFANVSDSLGINYVHNESDFIDFNVQKLLPHKLSEYGPGMAVADLDGNGTDDIIITGSYPNKSTILLQQASGQFKKDSLPYVLDTKQHADEMGVLAFDADNDGDQDIYLSSGGYERQSNSPSYSDHLFINQGNGKFIQDTTALPINYSSKSCVRASDIDHDGDLDIFLAGRVDPWKYPASVSSFIYRNDSKQGKVKFTDVTAEIAPGLKEVGLTCDALFTDFDNDGWEDLMLAGEWMPIMSFKNNKGKFNDVTANSGVVNETGFWSSIAAGDFDNDGDMDYALGNMGLNSFYRTSPTYPATIYGKDFNGDGNYDAVPTLFLPTSYQDKTIRQFPAQTRDDMIKQMISMRAKFPNYNSYATSTIDKVLTPEEMKGALVKKATNFSSSVLINDGTGKFKMQSMPELAQVSNVNGMVVDDFNADGNLDVVLCGNDYGTEISVGRYDALNGMLLNGDGKGGFKVVTIAESGIYIPGNAKAMVKLLTANNSYNIVASQNRDKLRIARLNAAHEIIKPQTNESSALVTFKNGKKQKIEFPYGSSFLSQSSRFMMLSPDVASVSFLATDGKTRVVKK